MSRAVRRIAFALVMVAVALSSAPAAAESPAALGRRLVDRYLADVRRHDVADLRKFLSPAWQIQRADGSRLTKRQYLRNLPTVRTEVISKLRVTSAANALVVTFLNRVNEVIGGKQFRTSPTPRLAAFVHGDKGWLMVAFANFNTPAARARRR